MKLIDLLEETIQEIGDATSPVAATKTGEKTNKYGQTTTTYEFKIGEDTYIVTMYISKINTDIYPEFNEGDTTMEVIFGIKTDQYSTVGDTSSTNKGVQYKVMSTVTKIIKDYVDSHKELAQIAYEPVKRDKEDQSRLKLYKVYIQKALPNWNYKEDSHGWVYLEKPQKKKGVFKSIFK